MSSYIPVQIDDARYIWVEVDSDPDSQGVKLVASDTTIKKYIRNSFAEVCDLAKENAGIVLESMRGIDPSLREIEIAYSIKIDFETQVPIFALAKASAGGNYSITLKFTLPQQPDLSSVPQE